MFREWTSLAQSQIDREAEQQEAREYWEVCRMNEIIEALAGKTADHRDSMEYSRLKVRTAREGEISVYEGFTEWLVERPELIDAKSMRDLVANSDRLRVNLFKQYAVWQAVLESSWMSSSEFAE
jgi:hypothetical protein